MEYNRKLRTALYMSIIISKLSYKTQMRSYNTASLQF